MDLSFLSLVFQVIPRRPVSCFALFGWLADQDGADHPGIRCPLVLRRDIPIPGRRADVCVTQEFLLDFERNSVAQQGAIGLTEAVPTDAAEPRRLAAWRLAVLTWATSSTTAGGAGTERQEPAYRMPRNRTGYGSSPSISGYAQVRVSRHNVALERSGGDRILASSGLVPTEMKCWAYILQIQSEMPIL